MSQLGTSEPSRTKSIGTWLNSTDFQDNEDAPSDGWNNHTKTVHAKVVAKHTHFDVLHKVALCNGKNNFLKEEPRWESHRKKKEEAIPNSIEYKMKDNNRAFKNQFGSESNFG